MIGDLYVYDLITLAGLDGTKITTKYIRAVEPILQEFDGKVVVGSGSRIVQTRERMFRVHTSDKAFWDQVSYWQSEGIKCTAKAEAPGSGPAILWLEPTLPTVSMPFQNFGDRHVRMVELFSAKRNAAIFALDSSNLLNPAGWDSDASPNNRFPLNYTIDGDVDTVGGSFNRDTGLYLFDTSTTQSVETYARHWYNVAWTINGPTLELSVPIEQLFTGVGTTAIVINALDNVGAQIAQGSLQVIQTGMNRASLVMPVGVDSLDVFIHTITGHTGNGSAKIRQPSLRVLI